MTVAQQSQGNLRNNVAHGTTDAQLEPNNAKDISVHTCWLQTVNASGLSVHVSTTMCWLLLHIDVKVAQQAQSGLPQQDGLSESSVEDTYVEDPCIRRAVSQTHSSPAGH